MLLPRDKLILAVQGVLAAYVIFQVGNKVYQHLKAKDRLKCKCLEEIFSNHCLSFVCF